MKILILGAKGMLGQELAHVFADYQPILWTKDDFDITSKFQVYEKIASLKPELIINAAAYTSVDDCETNEDLATKINGQAVGCLAEVANKIGAKLIHYSTDYVFDGKNKEGYGEDDKPNPISAYGRSKLEGELQLKNSKLTDWYIIRTAWLYSMHGKNFVKTMLSLADKGQPIKVVVDQIGSPTYAYDLALATRRLLESQEPSGIYHLTNSSQTSWYGFAQEIFKVFDKQVNLSSCTTIEYPVPAKRPAYSVLRNTKIKPMRSWQEALRAYKEVKKLIS